MQINDRLFEKTLPTERLVVSSVPKRHRSTTETVSEIYEKTLNFCEEIQHYGSTLHEKHHLTNLYLENLHVNKKQIFVVETHEMVDFKNRFKYTCKWLANVLITKIYTRHNRKKLTFLYFLSRINTDILNVPLSLGLFHN